MFNKKLRQRIDQLDKQIDSTSLRACQDYWSLRCDIDRLVEALGMIKEETHKIEYVKKGGPEQC